MKIVMEKNRTNREIREALRDAYEQVAEAVADALMFDFEAENLEVEDYLAFDRDGVWGLDWGLFDEDDFKRWEKELRTQVMSREEFAKLRDSKVVKERNLTRAQYMSSRYYCRKYGPLETVYVSGSEKLYKTTRYDILALKPE